MVIKGVFKIGDVIVIDIIKALIRFNIEQN